MALQVLSVASADDIYRWPHRSLEQNPSLSGVRMTTAVSGSLEVAADLHLGLEAVTQTFAIFGKRGSGKSNTAVVLAEEMFHAGAPFVVLDPISAWWGLKSSFDGGSDGLPVYVFGGPHGDLPLESGGGELMARILIKHRIPMVLDMKGWTGTERARFVTDFALYLLGHNERQPVHVFMEEADAFVPQRPYKGEEKMLGAMDRLVRWGRQEGIGVTLITQRSAKVNKDVTTQAETLIAHRTVGPQDRDAIDSWIKYHADGDQRQEILSTLPTLEAGTAWLWSPEWLNELRQVHFRRRQTFDSASTPKMGERVVKPRTLAAVDLEQLRSQLSASIDDAKANDPRELRKRIAQLERQAAKAAPSQEVQVREVSVVTNQDRELFADVKETLSTLGPPVNKLRDILMVAVERLDAMSQVESPPKQRSETVIVTQQAKEYPRAEKPVEIDLRNANGHSLTPALQRIIDALGWWEAIGIPHPDRLQVGFLSRYSAGSGSFNNNLGTLRTRALVDYPAKGAVCLTDQGRELVHPVAIPRTDEALQAMVLEQLQPAQRRILSAIIAAYPDSVSRDEVAEATGYSAGSGSFNNNLGALRSRGLIEYPHRGSLVAQPVLFIG